MFRFRAFPREILQDWVNGTIPTDADLQALALWERQDQVRLIAFGIEECKILANLQRRSHLLLAVAPEFQAFCIQQLCVPEPLWETLWHAWLPLAMHIAEQRQRLNRLMVQGILGGQGTGKTTLTHLLQLVLKHLDYHAVSLSLDDLYKTFRDREALKITDPRLDRRGPPGTHDIDLGLDAITQLRAAQPDQLVALPRFNKALQNGSGDRTDPEWVCNVDILFLEGWFVGVKPISPEKFLPDQLTTLPAPIRSQADLHFAADMNQALSAYLPLWETLDSLIVLYPSDYRLSKGWRKKAEQELRSQGQGGMSDQQINEFVEYFWKALHPQLFVYPLVQASSEVSLAIEIQPNHLPGRITNPRNLSR